MLQVAIGVVLILLSVGLVLYLLGLLLGAARLPLGALVERRRLQWYEARAAHGDRLLEAGALEAALAAFRSALYPYPANNRAFANAVANHHTGLLSRFIVAADSYHGQRVRLISLAKADRLFHERRALQARYLIARANRSRRRQRELERVLRANARELRMALAALAAEIQAARERETSYPH